MTWLETVDYIDRLGIACHELRGAGGRALVTPLGARVIALTWDGESHNPLYVHPGLMAHREQLGQRFAPGGGMGGDRLWLSPEYRYFWTGEPRLDDFSNYLPPPAMDPGDYRVADRDDHAITLTLTAELPGGVRFRLSRTIGIQAPPSPIPGIGLFGLRYRHELELLDGPEEAQLGLWSILQVPPDSRIMVPTAPNSGTSLTRVVGDPSFVTRRPEWLLCNVTGGAFAKVGAPIDAVTGRAAVWQSLADKRAAVLIREFPCYPHRTYGDALVREQVAQQAVQIFDGLGFGEMETHAPTLDHAHPSYSETTLLWALIGGSEPMRTAAESFLQRNLPE